MPHYRHILRQAAGFSLSPILARAVSFLLLPVYTRWLTPQDYGILELLDLTIYVFATLFGMQFANALYFEHARAATDEERSRARGTALLGTALLGLAGFTAGELLARPISFWLFGHDHYLPYLRLALGSVAFTFVLDAGLSSLLATHRVALWNRLSITRALTGAALNLALLVLFGFGLTAFLWSSLISNALVTAWLVYLFRRDLPHALQPKLFWSMLKYSAPLGVGGLAMLFVHYGDRFFLQRSVSLTEIGIYALAYKVGMLIGYLQQPFNSFWESRRCELVRRPDGGELYARTFTYFLLGLSLAGLGLTVAARPLIGVLAPPSYHTAAQFVPWLIMAYLFRSAGEFLRSVFFIEGRTTLNARVVALGGVCCLVGYAILIPRAGVWGAVLATLIAFALQAAYSWWEAQRVRRFEYETVRLFKLVTCWLIAAAPSMLWDPGDWLAQVALASASWLAFPLLLWLTQFADRKERVEVRRLLARLGLSTAPA